MRSIEPRIGAVCRDCGTSTFRIAYNQAGKGFTAFISCSACGKAWKAQDWGEPKGEAMGEARDERADVVSAPAGGPPEADVARKRDRRGPKYGREDGPGEDKAPRLWPWNDWEVVRRSS